jgi:branched-chain amino acid transport system permease protein
MIDYLASIGALAASTAIAVMGLCLLTPFAGYITTAAAAFLAIGAYCFAAATTKFGLSPALAVPIAVAFCGIVSGLVGVVLSRLRGEIHLLATLAVQLAVIELLRRWREVTNGDAGLSSPRLWPAMSNSELFTVIAVSTVLLAAALHFWLRGPQGLILRAIRDDREVAEASGCRVLRESMLIATVAGALFGLAGVLMAMVAGFIEPKSFDLLYSFNLLLMAILAGANVVGAICAAMLLILLPEIVYSSLDLGGAQVAPMQNLIYGLILVALMMTRPRGIFPELRLKRPRRS